LTAKQSDRPDITNGALQPFPLNQEIKQGGGLCWALPTGHAYGIEKIREDPASYFPEHLIP